jgi:hypothetical protein
MIFFSMKLHCNEIAITSMVGDNEPYDDDQKLSNAINYAVSSMVFRVSRVTQRSPRGAATPDGVKPSKC